MSIKFFVMRKSAKWRSECPLNASVEMLGDKWSLLIVRDMMLRGASRYQEFLECYEGIATNILADRLKRLIEYGIIEAEKDRTDGRKLIYSLTKKGIDLAPVLTEMVLWAAGHETTGNEALVKQLRENKEKVIAEVREKWSERRQGQ
jgi:DNA-binding HxlR family transcriptional regulator